MRLYLLITIILIATACNKENPKFDTKLFQIFKTYEKELGSKDKLIERFQVWESNGLNLTVDYLIGNSLLPHLNHACQYEDNLVYLLTPHSGNMFVDGMSLKDYNSSIWALKNMQSKPKDISKETFLSCQPNEILIKTIEKKPLIFSESAFLVEDIATINDISNKLLNNSSSNVYYYCFDEKKIRNTFLSLNLKEYSFTGCNEVSQGEIGKQFQYEDASTRIEKLKVKDISHH